MSFFKNPFDHKNKPESTPVTPSNKPDEFDDERKGGSLDENFAHFTGVLDKEDKETDIDQAA